MAKAQPGKLSLCVARHRHPQHIAGEMLKRQAGIDIVHVPYRGAVFTDVIGGRVTMSSEHGCDPAGGARRPVARARGHFADAHPDHAEPADHRDIRGLPGFEAISWFGLLAPAGTPAPIVSKVYQQAAKIAMEPEMKAKLAQLGLDAASDPPVAFAAIIKADIAQMGEGDQGHQYQG